MSPVQHPVTGPALVFDLAQELRIVHGVRAPEGGVLLLTVALAAAR
jgi:hypothetical protein